MVQLLLEEEDINAVEDEHFEIIACLLQQHQANEFANAEPIQGGSSVGRRKMKPMQMMEGHCIIYADYLLQMILRCRFWMNMDLFLWLVHGVREYDSYFQLNKDCVGMIGY